MIADQIRTQLKECQEEFQNSVTKKYYLISNSWLEQYYKQELKDNNIPINHQIIDHDYKNIIQYNDNTYNVQLISKLKETDVSICKQETWDLLKCYQRLPIQRKAIIINNDMKSIQYHFNKIRLVPLVENIQSLIEGYQLIDKNWSLKEFIEMLEELLQFQLSYQVPRHQFIRLYFIPKSQNLSRKQLKDNFSKREIIDCQYLYQLDENLDNLFVLLDIKETGKDYYFKDPVLPFPLELDETSQKGMALYEDQTNMISCLLKCYECIKEIRLNLDKYPQTKEIVNTAYYSCQDVVYYNNVELLSEIIVEPKYSYIETFFFDQEPQQKPSNFQWNTCYDGKALFFSSNEQSMKVWQFVPGMHHQVRRLRDIEQPVEGKIKLTICECLKNEDEFFNYEVLAPLQFAFIPKLIKGTDLHYLIADILRYDANDYENQVLNKVYTIQFRTNQAFKKKCQYCGQELCHNCNLEFSDKQLNLKEDGFVYIIYKEGNKRMDQNKQKKELLNLDQAFNFKDRNEPYLILHLQESMEYFEKDYDYKLAGLIDVNNQVVVKINEEWIEFPSRKPTKSILNRKVQKLFYVR